MTSARIATRVKSSESAPRRAGGPVPTHWAEHVDAACTRAAVEEVLGTPGRPLDQASRPRLEARLGHDFSRVRVHTDDRAAASARLVAARAYTVGPHVVFGDGQYAPTTMRGQQLLTHELTHVLQQDGQTSTQCGGDLAVMEGDRAEREARQAAEGRPVRHPAHVRLGLQRDGDEEDAARRWPGLGGPTLRLQLDPAIEAQIQASRYLDAALAPERIRNGLLQLDLSLVLAAPRPAWLTAPTLPAPAPVVPRGEGPSTPRAASPGDVLRAVTRIPAVDSALTTLRTSASDRVRRDWSLLSTGERALVITQTAVIGGGALAAVLSSPEGRGFALELVQNRDLPVPGVPGLTFQFNLTGPDQRILFNLNVGALLPPSWGFH